MSGMVFGRPEVPCSDCSDGYCTMNCSRPTKREVILSVQRGPILLKDATRDELINCINQLHRDMEDLRRSMARR
jgi:hypothetical protein